MESFQLQHEYSKDLISLREKEEIKEFTKPGIQKAKNQNNAEVQMISSTHSVSSSLASPGDSGVQLLDSESEVTSVMSSSGIGCDMEAILGLDSEPVGKTLENDYDTAPQNNTNSEILRPKNEEALDEKVELQKPIDKETKNQENIKLLSPKAPFKCNLVKEKTYVMTKSDIDNQNVPSFDLSAISTSVPNYFDKFGEKFDFSALSSELLANKTPKIEMEHPIQDQNVAPTKEPDLMNVSLTSYELLDYTSQNLSIGAEQMHVSMSEEVNENLRIQLGGKTTSPIEENVPVQETEIEPEKPVEDQIVFRRQRKKKSKSDTPKKRVSFHEDILNSTKIDDIHINHGFITHEPDVSFSFFQRGFTKKPDVVKGRYSWAAEGDAPFYEKQDSNRKIQSDIYVNNQQRFSSTSSSSTGSISSSIDEEDDEGTPTTNKPAHPTAKAPKSSCLKKPKPSKIIDTEIVQEELPKRKPDSILLDTNIFGSLKNILNFSTSMPLAEKGLLEGQAEVVPAEDVSNRRRSCSNFTNFTFKGFEVSPIEAEPVIKKPGNLNLELAKTNLKLTRSEGFYPNYPCYQNLPKNILLCDSNVYEHKGISYSYEYDNFQKNFEKENKPKSSSVYKTILKEFNFFKRKAKEDPSKAAVDDFEFIDEAPKNAQKVGDKKKEKNETKIETQPEAKIPKNNLDRYASSSKLDWSDTETISDLDSTNSSRHLSSPKRKLSRANHYTVQSLKNFDSEVDISRMLQSRPTSSNTKTSLINRYLRNVTMKKMLDVKIENKKRKNCKYIGLYVKGVKRFADVAKKNEVDAALEKEILEGVKLKAGCKEVFDEFTIAQLRVTVFKNPFEKLLKIYAVRSAYTTSGDTKPLFLILSNTTLYICSQKSAKCNSFYSNHFVLPYTQLNTILLGPSAQTIHFSNYDKDMQCMVTTGCSTLTNDLVGQLEIAMRRDVNKPKLPAVKQLNMRDMVNLRRGICKQTAVNKDEDYAYYSIVNVQDFNNDIIDNTPLGVKEGPLMFKKDGADSRWETAYFILKAGVLYMLSSSSHRIPMKVFPLINGSCQGARRVFNGHRPHTFQVIVENRSLQLAAPDEYVASDWLQALVLAASGVYTPREINVTQSCSLLMTSEHILTVREAFSCTVASLLPPAGHNPIKGPQALSCAAIADLTSFRLPSAEQSWCILEFSCREVHECSGDWILYFSTNSELEHFISTLEMLWDYSNEMGESFPLSTIPETDPLSKKCVDVYTSLRTSWSASEANVVHMQIIEA